MKEIIYRYDFDIGDIVGFGEKVGNTMYGTVVNLSIDRNKAVWYYVEWLNDHGSIQGNYFAEQDLS